jgi:hypothetical protein
MRGRKRKGGRETDVQGLRKVTLSVKGQSVRPAVVEVGRNFIENEDC